MQNQSRPAQSTTFAAVRFEDVDEYRGFLSEADLSLVQLGPGRLSGRADLLKSGPLTLLRMRMKAHSILTSTLGKDRVVFAIKLASRHDFSVDGMQIDEGDIVLLNGTDAMATSGFERDTVAIEFEAEAFRKDLQALAGRNQEVPDRGTKRLSVGKTQVRSLGQSIAGYLMNAANCVPHPACAENFERRMRETLLNAVVSGVDADTLSTARTRDLAFQFQDLVRSQSVGRLSVARLCSQLEVSGPTLYRVVKDVFGLSPSRFLKCQRLTHARALLQQGDRERGAIKRAALDSGYTEMGRFSVDYKALFGESPSKTPVSDQ